MVIAKIKLPVNKGVISALPPSVIQVADTCIQDTTLVINILEIYQMEKKAKKSRVASFDSIIL
ncbi:hypothetical protein GO685_00830 [Wolbachia endosymbiont of Madathamugadia hiepei]|nr:hypothetical protein [Wolbachia endosymbiont of Madathamugadia hiepei]